MKSENIDILIQHFIDNYKNNNFLKCTLSNPISKNSDLRSISIKIIELKNKLIFSWTFKHKTKDITQNIGLEESTLKVKTLLKDTFLNADLLGTNDSYHYLSTIKGNSKLIIKKNKEQKEFKIENHNKQKNRLIHTEKNIYLRELDILDSNFQLKPSKQDKFKQINKYIEIISQLLLELKFDKIPAVVDMGSGKGYLTFALYDYLIKNDFPDSKVHGIEFRNDLVNYCNKVSKLAEFTNLDFVEGSIQDTVLPDFNILIALHACDTATDDAIFKGIINNADVIVVAPCCHKQIRKQISPNGSLKSLLSHGILLERQSEMITDSIRALLLEAYGYKTKVFEFIDAAHTPKNLMITAVRKKYIDINKQKLNEISLIKEQFGIKEHYLETLLNQKLNEK